MNCAGTLQVSKKHSRISSAEVFISIEKKPKAEHCLAEELTQILGLTGDIDLYKNSVFHEGGTGRYITDIDRIMIRTLYDKRLKNGMSLAQALPIAKEVILEIMRDLSKRARPRPNKGRP